MGHNAKEYKSEEIFLNQLFERPNKKHYVLEEYGDLKFNMIWIPSKVKFYTKLLGDLEAKKTEDDESIFILDNMINRLEGFNYYLSS